MRTVSRTWTISTWLVAHAIAEFDAVIRGLKVTESDIIALQSLRESHANAIATELEMDVDWEISHHPQSRLIPGRAVGLAVLSPHGVPMSRGDVISDRTSLWSKDRRIAQTALVERADHSGYLIVHGVGVPADFPVPSRAAPVIRLVPERIDQAPVEAVVLPEGATMTSQRPITPVNQASRILTTTFEMDWVQGDFPVA